MKSFDEAKLNQLLEFVKTFQVKEGRSPSIRQVMKAMNFSSTSLAQRYIKKLNEKNLIERDSFGKVITPTNLQAGKTIVAPLVGKVACGTPILAQENIEGLFKLPVEIFGTERLMILRAQGDSMTRVGINDGDLIFSTITNDAKNGDIVVALIDDSETVKRLYKKKGYAILHPENPKYEDIKTKDLIIQGVVKYVVRSL